MGPDLRSWEQLITHVNTRLPLHFSGFALFTLEYGGRAAYMETCPYTTITYEWPKCIPSFSHVGQFH